MRNQTAVSIVDFDKHHKLFLNETALKNLLLKNDIKDLPIAIISITGAFRKGKSFMLDFLLRYAKHQYNEYHSIDPDAWMGREEDPLVGFAWKGGSDRITTGILVWPEIFISTSPNGSKVCVMLLDTQGSFDSNTTVKEWATIFAVSTMMSSVQVYNLSQTIRENDLQCLNSYSEYGRMALNESGHKPFQKILFLIRDWSYPYEYSFGVTGGKAFLDKTMQTTEKQHKELAAVRKHIDSCYDQVECYLMPHPGMKVITNPKFDGRLAEISTEFKDNLKTFVSIIMAPDKLITKRINGEQIKAKDLIHYLASYVKIFNDSELPAPQTIFQATAEANHLVAYSEAHSSYQKAMDEITANRPYIKPERITEHHERSKTAAISLFDRKPKMGGQDFSAPYKTKLENTFENMHREYQLKNKNKNFFRQIRIPLMCIAGILILKILSVFLSPLGFATLASLCSHLATLLFFIFVGWCYMTYRRYMG